MQGDLHAPYLKNFLKKLINQVESDHGFVLDNLYELYAHYMASFKVLLHPLLSPSFLFFSSGWKAMFFFFLIFFPFC